MHYEIEISGLSETVDLFPEGDTYTIKFNEKGRKAIRVLQREQSRLLVEIDHKVYSVIQLNRSSSAVAFVANGKYVEARIKGNQSEQDTSSSVASVSEVVSSNFPARVVKVNAKQGETLEAGATLIVLEAMKMEAQIKVPRECTVVTIHVREGEMVEKGKPLARLKFVEK